MRFTSDVTTASIRAEACVADIGRIEMHFLDCLVRRGRAVSPPRIAPCRGNNAGDMANDAGRALAWLPLFRRFVAI